MQDTNQKQWLSRVLTRVPDYITLGLIVVSGSLLAQLTWLMFPAQPNTNLANTPQTNEIASNVVQAQAPRVNPGDEVARYHLFGQVQQASLKTPKLQPKPVVQSAKPKFPMKLLGVYNLSGDAALAILNIQGEQKVFGIGEAIKLEKSKGKAIDTGATLLQVGDRFAIVKHANGEEEKLSLPGVSASDLQDLSKPSNTTENTQTNTVTPSQSTTSITQPVQIASANSESAPKAQDLAQVRQQLLSNPTSIFEFVKPSPARKDGKLIGYRVNPGKDKELFKASGLVSGDIITKVNNIAVNTPNAFMALQKLKDAKNLQITVQRYGQETTIPINF